MTDIVCRAAVFAGRRHTTQRRKDRARTRYITHPAEVAGLVAGFGGSPAQIAAAWLHDTVEDCPPTSLADLAAAFGDEIAGIVGELTDDKSLPKARRKAMQIESAPANSPAAALVKLCDKISNVRSVGATPPVGWPAERRRAYLDWAEAVVAGLPALPEAALDQFRQASRAARDRIDARRQTGADPAA